MEASTLQTLNALREARKAAIVVKDLTNGNEQIFSDGETPESDLADFVSKAYRTGKSQTVEICRTEYFINAYLPPARLVVVGAVHISQALAPIAKIAGYDMAVIDPRSAFATQERFEGTQVFADWPEDILKGRPLDPYCALAAVTHDPKIDDLALVQALQSDCFYVGALGSRKTHAKRVERLLEHGLTQEQIDTIHSPIGLDIGAASPQEIAVAVMGEVIKAFRTRGL